MIPPNLSDTQGVQALQRAYETLNLELEKVIVGQKHVVKDVMISIFSKGHCLLIGVPGLAKTLLVTTISRVLGLNYNRIQFTPDLMPSDIIGSEIIDETRQFKFVKGPLFANIILADEINRTPPKTQAALLEAMQEKAVTFGGQRYELEQPFFVLATQNPIEQEGTYALPEAQLDRFMMNVFVDYPTYEEELQVVKATTSNHQPQLNTILSQDEILYFQDLVRRIPITDHVLEYAVKMAVSTRPNGAYANKMVKDYIVYGAGPRASQNLIIGAKCHAALHGKFAPDIEDVNAVAVSILRHRLVKNYKAEADGVSIEMIIKSLMT
jgi:MoxR-like ATPase